jgi:hypothetical protein
MKSSKFVPQNRAQVLAFLAFRAESAPRRINFHYSCLSLSKGGVGYTGQVEGNVDIPTTELLYLDSAGFQFW